MSDTRFPNVSVLSIFQDISERFQELPSELKLLQRLKVERVELNAMQLGPSAMFWGVAPPPSNGYTLAELLFCLEF